MVGFGGATIGWLVCGARNNTRLSLSVGVKVTDRKIEKFRNRRKQMKNVCLPQMQELKEVSSTY